MKYEKFEEWMIGKKVTYGNHEGEITETYGGHDSIVCVSWRGSDKRFTELVKELEFLEEKPSEEGGAQENSQIDWQVGQTVWDVRNGRGIVKEISDDEYYPIYVVFDLTDRYGDDVSDTYTRDGRYIETQKIRSLFFSEPVITAELFPPKKPFIPTLKKGDKVVLTDSVADYVAEVVREEENHIYYKTEDGVVTFVDKNLVKVFKLGEEIKFES